MSDSELDYEIVTSASQLDEPPPLRKELVVLPEWKKRNGKAAAFYVFELTAGEHDEFDTADNVFDEVGNIVKVKRTGRQLRFLAYTVRDAGNNRIWPTLEEAERELSRRGRSAINKLIRAANNVNYGDAASADEAEADAEGKSEETQTSK